MSISISVRSGRSDRIAYRKKTQLVPGKKRAGHWIGNSVISENLINY